MSANYETGDVLSALLVLIHWILLTPRVQGNSYYLHSNSTILSTEEEKGPETLGNWHQATLFNKQAVVELDMKLDSMAPEPEFFTIIFSPSKLEAETLGKAMEGKKVI